MHLLYQSKKVANDFDPSWVFLLMVVGFVISSDALVILFLMAMFYDQNIV